MKTYEQKYKEALERARLLKLANPDDEAIQTFVKDSFPELEESEDERIRKALITLTKVPRKAIFEAQGITKEQALAWLEKQKEQKSVEWSEEDEEMFDEALTGILLAKNRMNDTGCIGLAERFEKAYKWLESFRPRPHWKPSEEQKPETKLTRWVARDENGEIYAYEDYPEKDSEMWIGSNSMLLDRKSFPDLKWEDEPMEVEITIRKK